MVLPPPQEAAVLTVHGSQILPDGSRVVSSEHPALDSSPMRLLLLASSYTFYHLDLWAKAATSSLAWGKTQPRAKPHHHLYHLLTRGYYGPSMASERQIHHLNPTILCTHEWKHHVLDDLVSFPKMRKLLLLIEVK